ncbi:MAG TPA: NAD(P)/FAD-dependent oxidoreductase [Burkholderiaceae bacterium]|nr:NAD(P)/FAD-dependent oxidoreductase [Burkholderiaceae bacterium]
MDIDADPDPARPRVVVVGAGFAGLAAVRALARAPVDVVLVDRVNHHLFQPLLYQVATAGLSGPQIAAPIRHLLRRQRNCTVLLGEATDVDPERRELRFEGRVLRWNALIVACGATHAYFGKDEWAEHAPGLKTLDDALALRRRMLLAFERAELASEPGERARQLTFAVIGGGPTGVELAGTLVEIARHTLNGEFRRADPRAARVVLVEAGPRVLSTYPESLSARAAEQLRELGVELALGERVTGIDAGGVALGERRLEAATVIWAAGVAGSPIARTLGVPLDRAGRIPVDATLRVPDRPGVWVAGDLAAVTDAAGRAVPGVAPAAKQAGRHAALEVLRSLRGEPPVPWRYRDSGSMATIGRRRAIADFGRVRLSGAPAWWSWLLVHVLFLIGFRNRAVVMLDWAWSYMTFVRHARLIVGDDERPAG